MNKPNIFKSRKFWITVADAVVSISTITVTGWLDPENAKYVLAVIAALQPAIYALITGITNEDVAFLKSQ
jgi:hypothetical protein